MSPGSARVADYFRQKDQTISRPALIAGEEEVAARELIAGAPRSVKRLAAAMRRRRTTLGGHADRNTWVKAVWSRADNCWDDGDVTGAQVEGSIALLIAHGLPLLPLIERTVAAVTRETGVVISVPLASADPAPEIASAEIADVSEPLSLDEQFLRLGTVLSRQIGLVIAIAERSGEVITKANLDALSVLLRLAERLDALAEQRAAEQQKRSDDEVAGILERVDERIVELAHAHAERLGREDLHE